MHDRSALASLSAATPDGLQAVSCEVDGAEPLSPQAARLLLSEAQSELNHSRCLGLLRRALAAAEAEVTKSSSPLTAIAVLCEMAVTEMDPRARRAAWMRAIRLLERSIAATSEPHELLGRYADVVVDASQDSFSDLYDTVIRGQLAQARRLLHDATRSASQLLPSRRAYFLSRLSAVRRAQALTQLGFRERRLEFLEAKGIAEFALTIDPSNSGVHLELANCHWALSRHAETDQQYALGLRQAESAFLSVLDQDLLDFGRLSLARFYRLTYQASRAADEFLVISARTQHRRRLLRETPILAESVQHLWYTGYPTAHVIPLIEEAVTLLSAAVDSGCSYARHVIDLAMLHAMRGDLQTADTILTRELITKERRLDWNALAEAITSPKLLHASTSDLAGLGVALGINSPVILNKLATYCRDFLSDSELALTFYKASLQLDPRSAMSLTNKARLLLDGGDPSDFREVRGLLDRAKAYADRRYTWWRHELNRLIVAKGDDLSHPAIGRPSETASQSFRGRRLAFHQIESTANPNERGLQFERFIVDLISVSFTEWDGSHRSPGAQNDGFFVHRQKPFRVETKWIASPVDASVLREFASRTELPNMGGCFISMSGFSETAVEYCRTMVRSRCLLLLDGEDIRSVVEGDLSFIDLVDFKYISFFKREDPYAKVRRRAAPARLQADS